MTTLLCTQKLLRSLGTGLPLGEANSDGVLGDWHANLRSVGTLRLVLCVSEKSLLPVIIPAQGLQTLPDRLPLAVAVVLRHLGVPVTRVEREVNGMQPIRIGRARSREVLGSMTDMGRELGILLGGHGAHANFEARLLEASLRLCQTPYRLLGHSTPADAALRLLGA
jgi:hypothetical protein